MFAKKAIRNSRRRTACPSSRLPRSFDKQIASDVDQSLAFGKASTATAVLLADRKKPCTAIAYVPTTVCKDGLDSKNFGMDKCHSKSKPYTKAATWLRDEAIKAADILGYELAGRTRQVDHFPDVGIFLKGMET